QASTALTATMITARITPAISESDCARSGSSNIRTSPRTKACSIRRSRNRYPLTCSRVVDCRAMSPPPAILTAAGRGRCHCFRLERASSWSPGASSSSSLISTGGGHRALLFGGVRNDHQLARRLHRRIEQLVLDAHVDVQLHHQLVEGFRRGRHRRDPLAQP